MKKQNKKGKENKGSKPPPFASFCSFCLFCLGLCLALSGGALSQTKSTSKTKPRVAQLSSLLSLGWRTDPYHKLIIVEVLGLTAAQFKRLQQASWTAAQWQLLLAVYAAASDAANDAPLPPMLGAYRLDAGVLRFVPQFPLEPGVTYRAVLRTEFLPGHSRANAAALTATFQLPPRSATPTTTVKHVYPSADLLPENLLKFYVYFSAPMNRGRSYEHIHLRDENGKEIELPFLELGEELWDPMMTRLTLFIDPGRIKRGVRPLEEIGPSLEAGRRYTLLIDRAWQDAAGNHLKEDFQKVFRVGAPDRQPPDPAQWQLQAPPSATRAPLTVVFPEPLDHALARRVIVVTDQFDKPVAGQTTMTEQERRWTFTPLDPWQRGQYQLVIQTTLEDLAGNNIGKPFELDLFEGVERRLSAKSVKLSFAVR